MNLVRKALAMLSDVKSSVMGSPFIISTRAMILRKNTLVNPVPLPQNSAFLFFCKPL